MLSTGGTNSTGFNREFSVVMFEKNMADVSCGKNDGV